MIVVSHLGPHDINNRFLQSNVLDGPHIKAVYIVPKVDSFSFDSRIFHAAQVHDSLVWEDDSTGPPEPFVSCIEDRVKHAFVEQKVAHPLGHNHVDDRHRQVDFLDLASDTRDAIGKTIDINDLLSLLNDGRAVYGIDVFSTGLDSKHGQNACATTDIHDNLECMCVCRCLLFCIPMTDGRKDEKDSVRAE